VDEIAAWLADRPRAGDRIRHRHRAPGQPAEFAPLDVHPRVERALDAQGIEECYAHQVEAIRAIRDGDDAVVATPTASGKSLVYTIPALERALRSGARTLYVAPMRALINDQETTLGEFVDGLGFGPRVEVAQYTGQQSGHEKRAIRDDEPRILLTTPDMLHYGILPHAHRLWEWLFESLETVVIDEIHEYRGVFGSHVALVMRRLARICERFGSDPDHVCCSATIGNPVAHASGVTGQPEDSFTLIEEDTSATGPRNWAFWNPPLKQDATTDGGSTRAADDPSTRAANEPSAAGGKRRSPHPETTRLFCDLLQRGYQTLVFTSARQTAERYAQQSGERLRERGKHDLADSVTAYQAALEQDRRDEIEAGLRAGEIRGVWSTNALELGIDIGGLDAVLLDGYPGTRMATHQRAGRAGRGTDPALVALVGGRDQLDQYFMANPGAFFDGDLERAVVNPDNGELLPDHVLCAARENWLKPEDDAHFGPSFPDLVSSLEADGALERRGTNAGVRWTYDGDGSPNQSLSLRTIDDREIRLIDTGRDETIARLPFADALRDAHPDAIYHHQGRTYEVAALELERGRALLRETSARHHTRALREKRVSIDRDLEAKQITPYGGLDVRLADVTVRERIDGYVRYEGADDDGTRVEFREPLPETTLRTRALYFVLPADVARAIRGESRDESEYGGALHAVEHGMISLFPLELLCDRRDIGGLSTPLHPDTGGSTVFIHDGHPGGVGLSRGGYEAFATLLGRTREMIDACPCEAGCPACIQSPHCGNANAPLSKGLGVSLIDTLESGVDP
jgi:DEAD/DEAH box helicase domain-containing protein